MSDSIARTFKPFATSIAARKVTNHADGGSAGEATKGVEVVYYIALDRGIVKIGTSTDFMSRKHAYAGKRILAVEFGGRALERERHDQFAHLRIGRHEHFRFTPELAKHITEVRQAVGLTA